VAALIVGVVFGIAPAFQATAVSATEAMGADSRTTGGGGSMRNLLVMGEAATAVLLLFGAGLLLRTSSPCSRLIVLCAGSVLTMLADPLGSAYPPPVKQQQLRSGRGRSAGRACVADVGWSSGLPLGESVFGEYLFVTKWSARRRRIRRRRRRPDTGRQLTYFHARTVDCCRPRIRCS
jgi:hypothetical protein